LFRLKLFGSASIEGPDGPVAGRAVQRRRLGLLALLALARERGVTRDKLIGYLWPDADADRVRHLLSDSVYRINQAVGGEGVIAVGDELRLNPERLPCDAWEFSAALERRDWQRAVELHVAPFLDGFYLTDADELERWVDAQRERLARERARALEALAEEAERDQVLPDAVRWWRALAVHDPYSSRIALRLMRALDRAGERAAALQHARVHALLLDEEMGLAPDPELESFSAELRSRPQPPPVTTPPSMTAQPQGTTPPSVTAQPVTSFPQPAARATPARLARPASSPPRAGSAVRLAAAVAVIVLVIAAAAVLSRDGRRAPGSAGVQAIAVLPFADLSEGGEYAYFADGMTDELMARLAHVEGLEIVGRTSVFAFRDQAIDVREIAARLNATAVLQGSVRHAGNRLRIVAQLIDAQDGYQLWTETYERQVEDVFAIQDDIAQQIVTGGGRRHDHRSGRVQPVPEGTLRVASPDGRESARSRRLLRAGR
jgi:serine/threonine-protein kinase